MPLEAPRLDRSFKEIFESVRERIPRYTPEWTDFNESDPGITLVQLFSWISEQIHYQMDQLPEQNYIKLLQLLNFELRPPTPATAHVTFVPELGTNPAIVRRGTRVGGQNPETRELVIFETDVGMDVVPAPLVAVQTYVGGAFGDVTEENAVAGRPFAPLGRDPQPGNALYLGFAAPPTLPPKGVRFFPQQVRLRVFAPPLTMSTSAEACDSSSPLAPDVQLVWEYRHRESPERWRELVATDETARLTKQGYLLLEGPGEIAKTTEGRVTDSELFWLRCRLQRGTYPTGQAPSIDFIRPNTVPATALTTAANELLGVSEGHPNQYFDFRHKPVDGESLIIEVKGTSEPETWTRVEDFYASGPEDRHFRLEHVRGRLTFGDGAHGAVPIAGSEVIAARYRYGGGGKGNLPRGTINTPLTTLVGIKEVINEQAAVGGREEQELDDLKREAPEVLRHRNRAVTAEDFSALARMAGGVARATALPLWHPDYPGATVPGAVTVVIVPEEGGWPPIPSVDLRRHVCRELSKHRLLTTEVHVAAPEFVHVSVRARIAAAPYAAFGAVEVEVREAIDAYLDPMHWEFGRDLYPTSLFAEILRGELAAEVLTLEIFVDGGPHEDVRAPVTLRPNQLLYGADHDLTIVERVDR